MDADDDLAAVDEILGAAAVDVRVCITDGDDAEPVGGGIGGGGGGMGSGSLAFRFRRAAAAAEPANEAS